MKLFEVRRGFEIESSDEFQAAKGKAEKRRTAALKAAAKRRTETTSSVEQLEVVSRQEGVLRVVQWLQWRRGLELAQRLGRLFLRRRGHEV